MVRAAARFVSALVGSAMVVLAVAAIVVARSNVLADPFAHNAGAPPSALTADQLKSDAAQKLEQATGKGGGGYAFDIVQTSTITSRPGGPLIEIPSPTDAREIIGQADEYLLTTLLERGVVTPEGFWSELRGWPIAAGGTPDFEKADLHRAALARDGISWRNDRAGWYRAEVVPGVGLDPATAALLPTLLRNVSDATKQSDEVVDGRTVLRVDATAQKADIPGVVAADGLAYTKLIAPIEFGFDALGRVVRIHAVALNLNMTDFDLVVDTIITIRYEDVGGLPQPEPTWVPVPVDPAEVGE